MLSRVISFLVLLPLVGKLIGQLVNKRYPLFTDPFRYGEDELRIIQMDVHSY